LILNKNRKLIVIVLSLFIHLLSFRLKNLYVFHRKSKNNDHLLIFLSSILWTHSINQTLFHSPRQKDFIVWSFPNGKLNLSIVTQRCNNSDMTVLPDAAAIQ
ncbi:hypothetical protein Tcan_00737, partial [Toxocara canis]